MHVFRIIFVYLLLVNIIGFVLMGLDKYRSRKRSFRIPESNLFIVALMGGSIGSLLGMYLFRHKTRHWYFTYGMPLILFIQVLLVLILLFYAPIEFKII